MSDEAIFTSDRYERQYYEEADQVEEIDLPLTRDGFEALLKVICAMYDLPINDSMRLALIAQLHHIEAGISTTTIHDLGSALHRAVSNAMTWGIDQEIKDKRRKEQQEKADKIAKEKSTEENKILPLQ